MRSLFAFLHPSKPKSIFLLTVDVGVEHGREGLAGGWPVVGFGSKAEADAACEEANGLVASLKNKVWNHTAEIEGLQRVQEARLENGLTYDHQTVAELVQREPVSRSTEFLRLVELYPEYFGGRVDPSNVPLAYAPFRPDSFKFEPPFFAVKEIPYRS